MRELVGAGNILGADRLDHIAVLIAQENTALGPLELAEVQVEHPAALVGQAVVEAGDPPPLKWSALKYGFWSLNASWFLFMADAGSRIDAGRDDYNHHRLHTSLGNLPPAEFADQLRRARELS